jgi:hypothetical protein
MDFFQSHQTVPKPLLSYLLLPERSIALVKRLAGSPKGAEIDPNLPHANKKVLPKVVPRLRRTKRASRCYLTFFHFPERSIALVKRLAGSPKELKLIPTCPTLTKCYSKVAHAFLYTLMDFFQSHQTVPKPLLSYLLPFSERSAL